MRKNVLVLLLVIVTSVLFAVPATKDYLVKVRLADQEAIFVLADRGARVVAELDGCCLALMNDDELSKLEPGFRAEVLDANPGENLYFLVTSRAGTANLALEHLGRVVYRSDKVVLLGTTEENVLDLNRLPVELCHVSMEPMVISRDDAGTRNELRSMSDTLVARIVSTVSQDSVLGTIRRLQSFYTRYSSTDSCRAAVNYMLNRMQSYGCDSVYGHNYRSAYAPNAVGIKWGQVNRRRSYIICGHIDNTSEQAPQHCPGSDDNASGTTAAIEACRVFANYDFDYTVKFIGFTGEEQGLYGSDSFSNQAYRRHDTILGVLNFDMISYGRQNHDSIVITGRSTSPNCAALVNAYCANADTYTTLRYQKSMISSGGYGSDHYYFWQRGYVALWGMEKDETPEYHTTGDTVGTYHFTDCGTNNIPLCTEGIKTAVATLAKLAGAHQVTAVEEKLVRSRRPRLEPNCPNPFGDRTTIRYNIGTDRTARIRIYDTRGALVNELTGVGAGSERVVSWNGRNQHGRRVVPGIYFYRLEGNYTSDFCKAVLVRK